MTEKSMSASGRKRTFDFADFGLRLEEEISDSDFYAQENNAVQRTLNQLSETQSLLEQRMERWADLASQQQAYDQSRNQDL